MSKNFGKKLQVGQGFELWSIWFWTECGWCFGPSTEW